MYEEKAYIEIVCEISISKFLFGLSVNMLKIPSPHYPNDSMKEIHRIWLHSMRLFDLAASS